MKSEHNAKVRSIIKQLVDQTNNLNFMLENIEMDIMVDDHYAEEYDVTMRNLDSSMDNVRDKISSIMEDVNRVSTEAKKFISPNPELFAGEMKAFEKGNSKT